MVWPGFFSRLVPAVALTAVALRPDHANVMSAVDAGMAEVKSEGPPPRAAPACGGAEQPLVATSTFGVVCWDGRLGVNDADGHIVVPTAYDFVAFPTPERILVRRGRSAWTLFNTAGEVLLSGLTSDCADWTFPMVLWRGREVFSIVEPSPSGEAPAPYHDDRGRPHACCGLLEVSRRGKHGLLSTTTGAVVLPLRFDEIVRENNEFLVRDKTRWGIADLDGHLLVEPRYETIETYWILTTDVWESRVARRRGHAVLLNDVGVEISRTYDAIGERSETGLRVVERDGRFGVIDNDGTTVLPTQYEEVVVSFDDEILARRRGRWGAFRRSTTVLPAVYDGLTGPFLGLYRARLGRRLLWFDVEGRPVEPDRLRAVATPSPPYARRPDDEPPDDRVTPAANAVQVFVLDDPPIEHGPGDDLVSARTLVVTNTTTTSIAVKAAHGSIFVGIEQWVSGVWQARPDLQQAIWCGNSTGILPIRPGHQRTAAAHLPRSERGTFRFVVDVDGVSFASEPVPLER